MAMKRTKEKIKVYADLRAIRGWWVMRFRYTPYVGEPRVEKNLSTKLKATPANKNDALQMMWDRRKEIEEEVNYNYVPVSRKTQFTVFMRKWIEELERLGELERNTWEGYERNIRKHILPYFEPLGLTVQEIKVKDLNLFYKALQNDKGLSPNTIHKIHICIHKAFKDACAEELITFNPATNTKRPKIQKFENEVLNREEFLACLEVFRGDPIEVAVNLGAFLGMRRSEILALKWQDIDLEQGILYIKRTRVPVKGEVIEKSRCKNFTSHRKIYIPEHLKELLETVKLEQSDRREYFGNAYYEADLGEEQGYVCCKIDGSPLEPSYITHRFHDVMVKSNLPVIRFHDLRHTVAHLLRENGASAQDICDLLGHSSITTTCNIYLGFSSEASKETAEKIENLFKK